VTATAATPTAAAPVAAQAVEEPERNPDEAYIETARCSTCNECTQLNGKMFAYNENQQAYIADINAGTYAQLVEAAENCQVAVIHPGKPRNPDEPGLAELLKRAEAYL
jgi:ferredoxin